jgi:hypothetical protein
MPVRKLLSQVEGRVHLEDWDKEIYPRTGLVRWKQVLYFYGLECVKAGFLTREKGVWSLTSEGEGALKLGPKGLLDRASRAYRKWKLEQPENRRICRIWIPYEWKTEVDGYYLRLLAGDGSPEGSEPFASIQRSDYGWLWVIGDFTFSGNAKSVELAKQAVTDGLMGIVASEQDFAEGRAPLSGNNG